MEKKQRNNIWHKRVFLKGLEQTGFCGTLGNRSGRLSSGKLWANINEALKIEEKKKVANTAAALLLQGSWCWTDFCESGSELLKKIALTASLQRPRAAELLPNS